MIQVDLKCTVSVSLVNNPVLLNFFVCGVCEMVQHKKKETLSTPGPKYTFFL